MLCSMNLSNQHKGINDKDKSKHSMLKRQKKQGRKGWQIIDAINDIGGLLIHGNNAY